MGSRHPAPLPPAGRSNKRVARTATAHPRLGALNCPQEEGSLQERQSDRAQGKLGLQPAPSSKATKWKRTKEKP